MVLNNFLFYTMFDGKNVILLIYTACAWNKKLFCALVRDKNFSFRLVLKIIQSGLSAKTLGLSILSKYRETE